MRTSPGLELSPELPDILPGLERLDRVLELAVAKVPEIFGAETATDRFRGLYVSRSEAARLLARPPGAPLFADVRSHADEGPQGGRLGWIGRALGLTSFDLDVVLLALAPELDSRYERVFAYLQDDVTRRRPTVELALNLLCEDAADRLARRWHFSPGAPLLAERVIELAADPPTPAPTLLGHTIRIDPQIANLLLEQDVLDTRLVECCRVLSPASLADTCPLPDLEAEVLIAAVERAQREREALRLEFSGPRGTGKQTLARRLASAVGAELLVVDARRVAASPTNPESLLALAVREAWFRDALLYLRGTDVLVEEARTDPALLRDALAEFPGIAIVASASPLPAAAALKGAPRLSFGVPPALVRRRLWAVALERARTEADPAIIDALAERFRLTPTEIDGAAALAAARADLAGNAGSRPALGDLFAAARDQTGAALERLALRSRPARAWDDLVLPPDQMAQLAELRDRALQRRFVLEEWGFAAKLPRGRGVNALFAGPSGTGKTMAAEVIAAVLGVDLWRIDLAGVVSKYIGETEKNLDRIFSAAESANGVLLFDEAEALFGKRSEVRDSHDRYANIEIAYLLQKMEQFEGVAILATNLRGNLDEAFVRRLAFSIHFPFPDEASRRRIWDRVLPVELPLAADVDLDRLARDIQLTGGHIHNIALAAAFLAAADGRRVTMAHLLDATRREYQKLGKSVAPVPLAGEAK